MPKSRWKGWVKPSDVEPELLEKLRKYDERFQYYRKKLGHFEHVEAHRKAREEVPLTDAEFDTKRRLLDQTKAS